MNDNKYYLFENVMSNIDDTTVISYIPIWMYKYKRFKILGIYETNQTNQKNESLLIVYVLKYMSLYGIDNVRGDRYSDPLIENFDIEIIHRYIWFFQKNCTRCGYSYHNTNKCYSTFDIYGKKIDIYEEYNNLYKCTICYMKFDNYIERDSHNMNCKEEYVLKNCFKCGKLEHMGDICVF